MKHINEAQFEDETKKGLTVVDFFATWCGPCRMMGQILEEVEETNPEIKIVKIDVDENPNLARKFGIMSIPTIVVMKDGEMAGKHVGLMQADDFVEFVKSCE